MVTHAVSRETTHLGGHKFWLEMSPTISDEIAGLPSGARFFRADLHIHSFPASHDVKDPTMTPKGIVETAIAERLAIISVTDHNEIANVEATLAESNGRRILVIPGVELSTPQGHLLVYFGEITDLKDFYGKLAFAERGSADSRCQTSMLDCLRQIDPSKGFAILAHVDEEGGLERTVPGSPPHKGDIINQLSLLGIELRRATAPISYSPTDPDKQRAAFGKQRIATLGLGSKQFLARVMFSDSHNLSALGKNAQGNRRVTRIKTDTPSFSGLRVALQDADARIRLEDEIPQALPYLMGLKIEGGFLDGQTLHLSRNLNCIVGGRGAGKSTAFESIRCAALRDSPSPLIDSEVWPQVLHLVWVDEAGQQHTIRRRIEEPPENVDDADMGPLAFPMECYGQGETAQTSARARTDPSALLEYLDSFVSLRAFPSRDEELRSELLANQTQIEKAEIEVSKVPQFKRLLAMTQQQLKTLEKARAREVVTLERKVAEERSLRTQMEEKIGQLSTQAKRSGTLELAQEICGIPVPAEFQVGGSQYKRIRTLLGEFEAKVRTSVSETAALAKQFTTSAARELQSWRIREQEITTGIEAKRKQLASEGVRLDLAYIRKLAADEASYSRSLENLKTWEKHLKELKKARSELLEQRTVVRSSITAARIAFGIKASRALEGALGELLVSLKYLPDSLSTEAEQIIQQAMSWRTVQVPRASLLVQQLTVPKLLDAIQTNDAKTISELTDEHGARPFSIGDAREIVTRLAEPQNRFALERSPVQDRPKLTVTKKISIDGKTRHVSRDFSRLSLGQQQSVLLALMLSSESSAPLIIDQPEDNLDGEFIYYSLVPVLRRAKERRQVIVVTHNANIAVLGDAEQIIALKSTSDRSMVVAHGSIDDQATKKIVCQILEGSEEAFRRRAQIYGLK